MKGVAVANSDNVKDLWDWTTNNVFKEITSASEFEWQVQHDKLLKTGSISVG